MRGFRKTTAGFIIGAVTLAVASAALAQVPRSSVDMPASQKVPEFRDPKTGQVWTPLNVGKQIGPPTPQDLAFDPLAQAAYVNGVVTQRPAIVPLSQVPITAGPTVPIVNIGDATLSAVPGKRWQVVLYLQNNRANTVAPLIDCRFSNAGNLVQETHALVPGVGAGLRVALIIYGPKTDLFVDRAACAVKSP